MTKPGKKILKWIGRNVSDNNSYTKFDDIHIDEIYWKNRERKFWIPSGIKYLKLIDEYISENFADYEVILAIQLISKRKYIGLNFSDLSGLESNLDKYSSPSLYLFKRNHIPPRDHWQKIDFDLSYRGLDFFYSEYKEENEVEYRRCVFVLVKKNS